jgi:MFS family permease
LNPLTTSPQPDEFQRDERSERAFLREGALDAAKSGAGDSYITAFGVFLGGNAVQLGVLTTAPPVVGALAQAVSVTLIERLRGRRALLVAGIRSQAVLWVLVGLIPWLVGSGQRAVGVLIALAVCYHVAIGMTVPVWSSWIGDVVKPSGRGEFLGHRNRILSIVTFSVLLLAGQLLHQFQILGVAELGFVVLFFVAALSRWTSADQLRVIPDGEYRVHESDKFSFWQFVRAGTRSNFVKFVMFVSAVNCATAVAGPYFTVFLLREVKLTYVEFTALAALQLAAQFSVLRIWGRISDRFGNRAILGLLGWPIAVNPVLWLVSSHLGFVAILHVYSGIVWSGFNLAASNFVYDVAIPSKRARCVAYFAILNTSAICLGSVAGGVLIARYGAMLPIQQGMWTIASPYLTLFLLSGVLRAVGVGFLFPRFKEVRAVEPLTLRGALKACRSAA